MLCDQPMRLMYVQISILKIIMIKNGALRLFEAYNRKETGGGGGS